MDVVQTIYSQLEDPNSMVVAVNIPDLVVALIIQQQLEDLKMKDVDVNIQLMDVARIDSLLQMDRTLRDVLAILINLVAAQTE